MQPSPSPRSASDVRTAEDAVMLTLARLGRKMRQRLPGEVLDFGTILLMQALARGPVRVTDLAAALELDPSTVSRQVRQLEERGLVERTDDPDDRRAYRIGLSGEGRSRLDAGAARRRAFVGDLLGGWRPEDREQLRLLLNRLLDELDHQETTP
jgi:DNA-binding MarR family transcriptional regulator